MATEQDGHGPGEVGTEGLAVRHGNAELTLSFAAKGVRASVLRLPLTTHGAGDNGFLRMIIDIAREKGVAAYLGDAPTAGRPRTNWTRRTCSDWPWNRRRPARPCTRSRTKACRSAPSPR